MNKMQIFLSILKSIKLKTDQNYCVKKVQTDNKSKGESVEIR
jgi:hypothetical protein